MKFDHKALEAAFMAYQRDRMAAELQEWIAMGPKGLSDIRRLYEQEVVRREKLLHERIENAIGAALVTAVILFAIVAIGGLR
jgi:hypothetical protein